MPRKKKKGERLPQIRQLPSGSWTAKIFLYTDDNGKDIYKSVTSRDYDEVVSQLARLKADRKEIKGVPKEQRITFRQAADRYISLRRSVLSPASIRTYSITIEYNCAPILDKPVGEITDEDVQRLVNDMAATKSPVSVRIAGNVIERVITDVIKDRTFNVQYPKPRKPDISIPTEDEVKQMLSLSAGTRMHLPILLGSCCGMRRAEICGLSWDDVDLDTGIIHIRHAMVMDDKRGLHLKAPKNATSERTISAPDIVVDALRAAKEASTSGMVVELKPESMSVMFSHFLRKNGLRHFRFHDLRHYLVSVMLAQNVPKKYISDYVGHASERMIDTVYGHIMEGKRDEVQNRMKDYFQRLQK